jgi:hypothetical protein
MLYGVAVLADQFALHDFCLYLRLGVSFSLHHRIANGEQFLRWIFVMEVKRGQVIKSTTFASAT